VKINKSAAEKKVTARTLSNSIVQTIEKAKKSKKN
jgi:hypothetical protein